MPRDLSVWGPQGGVMIRKTWGSTIAPLYTHEHLNANWALNAVVMV